MTLLLLALVAADARPLSLEDALAAADTNRDLRAQQLREDQARADVSGAVSSWDPSFTASQDVSGSQTSGFIAGFPTDSTSTTSTSSVGLQGELPTSTTWSLGVDLTQSNSTTVTNIGSPTEQVRNNWSGLVDLQVTQDVLAPFRRSDSSIRVRQAREQLDLAELSTLASRQDTLRAIAQAWWTWAAASRTEELAAAALEQSVALQTQTQARFEEGDVLAMEVARVVADRLAAEQAHIEARAEVRRTGDALLLLMGEPPGSDIEPQGVGSIAGGETSLDGSVELALSRNPDVLGARAELEQAKAAQRDDSRSGLPTLNASGSLGVASLAETSMDALTQLRTEPLPRWALGIDMTVPLGGRAARADRDRAAAAVSLAEINLHAAEDTVRAEVRAAVDAVDAARKSVVLAGQRLEVAEATLDGELARVEEGEKRLDDLIAARTDVLEAAAGVIDAEASRASAELDLLALEGRLGGIDDL